MNLRSGTSVWQLLHPIRPAHPPLQADERCDAVVVGGGISGAMSAAFLARAGQRVILLDRRQPLQGSTLASTALLQYELDQPLTALQQIIGRGQAEAAYRACHEALFEFPAFAASVGGDSCLIARSSLFVAGPTMDGDALREEAAARVELGIDAAYLDGPELRGRFRVQRAGGAILSARAFEGDPVRLTAGCLQEMLHRGGRIFGDTAVVSHDSDGSGVRVFTSAGFFVRARHIVYATGYEAPDMLGFEVGRRLSTYALATTPDFAGDPWPQSALIWEAADPYLYARTTTDGRICIGGADEEVVNAAARDCLLEQKVAALTQRFGELMPGVKVDVATAWAGIFATTPDGLPCVGPVAGFPGSLFALGYSGNGMLFSFMAAQMVLDLLEGRSHPLAELFSFDRPVLRPSRLLRM